MAEEQDTWYEPSLMAWHERSNAGVILTDFIRSKAYVLKLSSRTRMLSVGPGESTSSKTQLKMDYRELLWF